MTEDKANKKEMLVRDAILRLLTDDEVASVSTAETALSLPNGTDYLDLEQLEKGVQTSFNATVVMGRVLPKKAVHEKTWKKILAALAELNTTAPHIN